MDDEPKVEMYNDEEKARPLLEKTNKLLLNFVQNNQDLPKNTIARLMFLYVNLTTSWHYTSLLFMRYVHPS